LQPIVQPVDDWNRNYKLGLLFEAKVGSGRLMVASADLDSDLDQRVVARQLRKSVLDYMDSAAFDPQTAISAVALRSVLFDTLEMKKLGAVASGGRDATSAIDGDPNTFWSAGTPASPAAAARAPHELTIAFPRPVSFSGLVVMPRQNHRDHEGDVRDYVVQLSDDGSAWRDLKRGALVSSYGQQSILFGQDVSARFIRFVSLTGFGADATSAIAELALVYTGPALPENGGGLTYKRVRSASSDIDENIGAEVRIKK
jgi:hypothetical protein